MEASGWRKLDRILEEPSSRLDLYRSVFLVADAVDPVENTADYVAYLNRLAIMVGQVVYLQNPVSYLREAVRIIDEKEKFEISRDFSFDDLLFQNILVNRKGPDIAIGIIMLAALRNVPYSSDIVMYDGKYFIRSGPVDDARFLDIETRRVVGSAAGTLEDIRLQAAPVLTKRVLLGHYIFALGRQARREGMKKRAHTLLQYAWHLAPQMPAVFMEVGRLALDRWELTRAERCFLRAVRLDPVENLLYARVGLADVYVRQHRFSEANDALKKAFLLENDDFYALLVRGEYFLNQQSPDYRAAQDVFESLLGRQDTVSDRLKVRLLCNLALTALGRKNRVKGKQYLEMVEKSSSNYAFFYYTRGMLEEDLHRAVVDYRKALAINERFAPACLKRGAIYEKLNLPEAAIRHYRMFIDVLPQHPLFEEVTKRIEELKADLGN
jgi:tetratricopeptide (TPR) repeat protein